MNKIIAIAINEYSDVAIPNLKNCIKDINDLIDVLSKSYQFDSIELFTKPEQTTYEFLHTELYNEFINSLDQDNILLVFAGHGEFNEVLGTSYWLCSDSVRSKITTWLNVGDLLKFFNASPSNHIALISDSCFSGAIFELYRGGGLPALENRKSRQALTSGGIEKVTDGAEDTNSPFNQVLRNVLTENKEPILSFSQLCERTILAFDQNRKQTPEYGPLGNSGDNGGMYFFRLKEENVENFITPVQIPLEINDKVKIESNFQIPFFNKNTLFDNGYVNAFVQELGYSIVNEVRMFMTEDEEYNIEQSNNTEYYLDVDFRIETINEKYLSVVISRHDYFGGIHPNTYIYSINFAFKPARKISIMDILDYSGFTEFKDFLITMAERYEEGECKGILKNIVEDKSWYFFENLRYSFNDESFSIYYMDQVPHAIRGCGILIIPIEEITFRF